MKVNFSLPLAIIFSFFLGFDSFGQAQLGVYGIVTSPTGSFSESTYGTGLGGEILFLSGDIFRDRAPLKMRFGASINGARADREKYKVETEFPVNGTAKMKFNNINTTLNWVLRAEKKMGRFVGYGDLLFGMRLFTSERVISLQDDPNNEYEDDNLDLTKSERVICGLGGGLSYHLSKNVLLDFSVNYTVGNSFTFLAHNTLMQDLNQICYKYETTESSDMLTYKIGFLFNLVGIRNVSSGGTNTNTSSATPTRRTRSTSPTRRVKKVKKKIKVKTNPAEKKPTVPH